MCRMAYMKYGYDSPESFTKAFTRFHGSSPMKVRKGSSIQFMNRYTVQITIEGGCMMEYKIEKWEAMDLKSFIFRSARGLSLNVSAHRL